MSIRQVIVVGAGPGGISAALWAKRLGLDVLLVEAKEQVGGQLLDLRNPVIDYLGIPVEQGRDLQPLFASHLDRVGVRARLGAVVEELSLDPVGVRVNGQLLTCNWLVLALGARRRALGVPGEEEHRGRWLSDSASRDREIFEGRTVAIVGGGDAALENAINLAPVCPNIFIINRSAILRARQSFQDEIKTKKNIVVLNGYQIRSIEGQSRIDGLLLQGPKGEEFLGVESVCVRVGTEPASNLLLGKLELDVGGFASVDADGRTSHPNIFAVGDIANPRHPSIAASVGQGMIAAKTISADWEAMADGEI